MEWLPMLDANEVYDPVTDKWTILEPMPSKRGGLSSAAIAVNESIYVFGGEQPTGTFSNNEKFDVVSDTWTSENEYANGTSWIGCSCD